MNLVTWVRWPYALLAVATLAWLLVFPLDVEVTDATLGRLLAASVLLGLTAFHYVVGLAGWRAAAGAELPLREGMAVQLAAAAANRVTPGGIGGAVVNLRFLRRCGLSRARAAGAIASVRVVGMLADLGLLALLLSTGAGTHTAVRMSTAVQHEARRLSGGLLLLLGAAVVGVLVTVLWRKRRSFDLKALRASAGDLTHLSRRPADVVRLVGASAGTSCVLGLALVATVSLVDGPHAWTEVPALLAAYMIATAVGSAAGVPSGIGTTDAALLGALVTTGVPLAAATTVVVVFRAVTFWAPAGAGVLAARHLRKAKAL